MDKQTLIDNSIRSITRTTIVPAILETICRTTGLGFAAVARVTPEHWIACEVLDKINFGMIPGSELKVDTTICHEIRQSGVEVLIDHVAEDIYYCTHATPAMYGFQSYISVPIRLADNSFFGTLCAIDPHPAALKSGPTRELFKVYASLIALLIDADKNLPDEEFDSLRDTVAGMLSTHYAGFPELSAEHGHEADTIIKRSVAELNDRLAELKLTL